MSQYNHLLYPTKKWKKGFGYVLGCFLLLLLLLFFIYLFIFSWYVFQRKRP